MRIYETIYVCPPKLDEEAQDEFADLVHEVIYDAGGKIIKQERWGKRRLAFEVKKFKDGFYYYFLYGGDGRTKEELERRLKLSERCIRFLTVRLDKELKGRKHKIFTRDELQLALQMDGTKRGKPKKSRAKPTRARAAKTADSGSKQPPAVAAAGGPGATEPKATEATEPKAAEAAEPRAAEATEPEAAEATEPKAVEAAEPKAVEATEPKAVETTEPEAVEATEPEAAEAAEPEAAEATEPEVAEAEAAEDEKSGGGRAPVEPAAEPAEAADKGALEQETTTGDKEKSPGDASPEEDPRDSGEKNEEDK